MGYARKDVEKTKKLAKKFVRYQEGDGTGLAVVTGDRQGDALAVLKRADNDDKFFVPVSLAFLEKERRDLEFCFTSAIYCRT